MQSFSKKIYLTLTPPSEDDSVSDHERIRQALAAQGYEQVSFPLHILQILYSLCRDCDFKITVTLVVRAFDWVVTAVEPGDTRETHYGLAVDYGSTMIVMELVDLTTGNVIAREREVNGQVIYGTDILTRITYALESPSHVDDLQKATIQTFNQLLSKLSAQSGINATACPIMILSGNTTMIHFLMKLNAWSVFASPYAPVTADPGWLWGRELGMGFDGVIYAIPAASNYVGGDIVSGLLTLEIHKQGDPRMFFDIGTNGELVIGNKDWLIAGAGAAGPALEGYISRFGMRAADGAVDTIKIAGPRLTFTTIGNRPPVGICGSGIIDLLAQMRINGWINIAGKLEPGVSDRIIFLDEENVYAAVYATADESATGSPLYFSQTDIDQYLDTKAAAYTMIDCLLETAGISAKELAHCYLSGAFCAHSDLDSAITIGIFPDLPREKYTAIANTSLNGAHALLLDRMLLQDVYYLVNHLYCVQFASIPDFLIRMQAAKFIPHTDMERYPSVANKLSLR